MVQIVVLIEPAVQARSHLIVWATLPRANGPDHMGSYSSGVSP